MKSMLSTSPVRRSTRILHSNNNHDANQHGAYTTSATTPIPTSSVTTTLTTTPPQTSVVTTGDIALVTGGAGFLGQHVVKQLHDRAPHVQEIRVLDLRPFTPLLHYETQKPLTSYQGSVMENDVLDDAMRGVSSVIHIAGVVSFGTFPDYKAMEQVNVDGTLNILRACLRHSVTRLLYCSTVDVVIGFEPIRGGREDMPIPKEFLFPGYPHTKLQGEHLVLAANGQLCDDGERLTTISLRANVMYGELDPYYVTTGLQNANSYGKLVQVGNGQAMFQQCYVGNTAAAFTQADAVLRENSNIGGEVFFIPDNTPLQNSFKFMETFLQSRGYALSRFYIPYSMMYGLMYLVELVLKALSPLVKIHLKESSCSIRYINTDLYFCSEKAQRMFNFTPVFSPQEAMKRSLAYYKSVRL